MGAAPAARSGEPAARDAVRRGRAALDAGDTAGAAQWFARACRLAPDDPLATSLLAAALAADDPARALALIERVIAQAPLQREAQVSRLALLHRLGRPEAVAALDGFLGRFALPAAPGFAGLADAIYGRHAAGWVGVQGDGQVRVRGAVTLRLGRLRLAAGPAGTVALPADWRRRGGMLRAEAAEGGAVLGATIDLAAIARVTGAVRWEADGTLAGWVAAPADPDTPQPIEVIDGHGAVLATAMASLPEAGATAPPGARGFRVAIGPLPPAATLAVRAATGRALAGSPLRPRPAPRRRPAAAPGPPWSDGARPHAVVLVTHAAGGGVERIVAARVAEIATAGARAIVVRPGAVADQQPPLAPAGFGVADGLGEPLAVATVEALAEQLRGDGVTHVELHHHAAHDPTVIRLAGLLRVPFDVVVHDFAAICPRVTLLGGAGRYCGEPADRRDCEDCVADHGARIPLATSVADFRAAQAMLLCAARRVTTPSRDAAARLRRFIPRLAPEVTPWEDDAALACHVRPPALPSGAPVTVAVVGAIGADKGYDVLLACARDAARRSLPLRFIVVGYTIDDERLIATEKAFVTGRFAEGEAPALLAEFAPALGLLPSVWPETWCFALSALWQAGLPVLAFDLGAPAERIAATGAGALLPPDTPAGAINDRCLAMARAPADTDETPKPSRIAGGRQAHG